MPTSNSVSILVYNNNNMIEISLPNVSFWVCQLRNYVIQSIFVLLIVEVYSVTDGAAANLKFDKFEEKKKQKQESKR